MIISGNKEEELRKTIQRFVGCLMMSENDLQSGKLKSVRIRDEVISKWGDDTVRLFQQNVQTDAPSDQLCITALTVNSVYYKAIMLLLAQGLRMPAKALLRVLFELSVKMVWCFLVPQVNAQNSVEKNVDENIRRWAKSSLAENIKLFKSFVEITAGDTQNEANKRLEEARNRFNSLTCEKMPKFYKVVEQIPGDSDLWIKELYTRFYRQFNNAVHLDVSSLCGRISYKDGIPFVDCGSNEPVDELAKFCATIEHIILFTIRRHYGWDTIAMDKEFNQVSKQKE